MTGQRISFHHLALLVHACDSRGMADAAETAGLAPSSLSTRLRALESGLGTTLFRRSGRQMIPAESAIWLYPRAVRLLLAELYLRRVLAPCGPGADAPELRIEIDVIHAGTPLAQALTAAIRARYMQGIGPFIDLVFTRSGLPVPGTPRDSLISGQVVTGRGRAVFGTGILTRPGTSHHQIAPDPWLLVLPRAGGDMVPLADVHLPDLPLARPLNLALLEDEVRSTDVQTDRLHLHLHACPDQAFLLPASLVSSWVRAARPEQRPHGQAEGSWTYAELDSDADPVLQGIVATLAEQERETAMPPFDPQLSLRHGRLFGDVLRAGSFSAAARVSGLTAPSLMTQLTDLENLLGGPLLARQNSGVTATDFGRRLVPACTGLVRGFDDLLRHRARIAAGMEETIRIGLPPSWGRDCATSEHVADALTAFSSRYAQCRVEVIEGPRTLLHEGVRNGSLNLAVVGRVDEQVGCLSIGWSEDIALIVSRKLGFRPAGPRVTQDEIARLPLVLAPEQVTMHRNFLTQMREINARIQPAMRIGSIPLIAAMIRRAPLCTILPGSVVQQDAEDGLVDVFPLNHIAAARRLWVIFSTDVGLTETERALVANLRETFGGEYGQAQSGPASSVPSPKPAAVIPPAA